MLSAPVIGNPTDPPPVTTSRKPDFLHGQKPQLQPAHSGTYVLAITVSEIRT
jgi:hypothetical protein